MRRKKAEVKAEGGSKGGRREEKASGMMDGLKTRTREYGVRVVRFFASLPRSAEAQVLGKQLLRSGTSVGANFREALRARSRSEYATKLNIGLMELEETSYWLELLEGAGIKNGTAGERLRQETEELTAIFVSLIKRAREEVRRQKEEGRGERQKEGQK